MNPAMRGNTVFFSMIFVLSAFLCSAQPPAGTGAGVENEGGIQSGVGVSGEELYVSLDDPGTPRLIDTETRLLEYSNPVFLTHLCEGWREEHSGELVIQADCIWSTSILSTMSLTVLRPADRELRIMARPHARERMPAQRVDVLWNGARLGVCEFQVTQGWAFVEFKFPVPAAVQREGRNTVTFASRFAVSAKEVEPEDPTADARRVSFGIRELELRVARPDAAADSASETEPLRVTDAGLSQQANTRIRFPMLLPAASRCVLRLGKQGCAQPRHAARVFLRRDTIEGVQESELMWQDKAGGASMPLDLDISAYANQVIEIVFDAANSDAISPMLWVAPAVCVSAPDEPKPPLPPLTLPPAQRVLLVVLDALRADELDGNGGWYGSAPFLSSLVDQGVRYDRAYASATWTLASVTSMLTGLFPFQHGVLSVRDRLSDGIPVLPEILERQQIATGCVGESPFFAEQYALGRGFDFFEYILPEQISGETRDASRVTARAAEFLRQHAQERSFLYVHFFPPHAPYALGNPRANEFTIDVRTAIPADDVALHDAEIGRAPMSSEGIKQVRARYEENVRYVDDQVAALWAEMDALGFGDETVVILTSDHGESFGEHGHLGHCDAPYAAEMRVPLLVCRGPRGQKLGATNSVPVSTAFLAPAIAVSFGIAPSVETCGRELSERCPRGSEHFAGYAASQNSRPIEAFMCERYKLILDSAGDRAEVYDCALDPRETANLAELRPVLADYLRASATAWKSRLKGSQGTVLPAEGIKMDQDTKKSLETLGYL